MNFESVVDRIRHQRGLAKEVPVFDVNNGNESAKYLFLFEAPGPKAIESGFISQDNQDPTAKDFKNQLHQAGITRDEIALWNVVPWYIGSKAGFKKIRASKSTDIAEGVAYLPQILKPMDKLESIVLAGTAARKAHVALSKMTTARILSCHHTSAQAMNANALAEQENIDVFKFMSGESQ